MSEKSISLSDLENDLNKFAKIINELNTKLQQLQQDIDNTRNAIIANSGAYQQTQLLIKKIKPDYFDKDEKQEKVVEGETKKLNGDVEKEYNSRKKAKVSLEDLSEESL